MTEDTNIDAGPAPEVLHDIGDGPSTPLQHKNPPQEAAPEPVKAPSASDAIKAAMAKVEAESKSDSEAPEKAVKVADSKAESDDSQDDDSDADEHSDKEVAAKKPDDAAAKEKGEESSEGKSTRIPSRLLPREREVWMNTPNPVKSAFERLEREVAEASQKHEASAKFYEDLREFDELAKRDGRNLRDVMAHYANAERMFATDFGRGAAAISQSLGKNPVEAVAQFMRAAGVLPQQLGAYLQGQPAQPQQQPQQRQQIDPVAQQAMAEVKALKEQMAEQQRQAAVAQAHRDMVEPFRQEHPRFDELQEDIAFFLNSGRIPASLSPVERLEAAYDMAERINPAPVMAQGNLAEPAENITRLPGKKSISGAPGKSTTSSGKPKIMSIRDSLAAAMRNA